MTVCAAALSEDSRAIICVSDNGLSYGDYIQWDSDSSKAFTTREGLGPVVMFAGSEEPTSRVLAGMFTREDDLGKDLPQTVGICEVEYKRALDELIEAKFLGRRLLDRTKYIAAISGPEINSYMRGVAEQIDNFEMDCGLLVCGFDSKGEAFILDVSPPGIVTNMTVTGFHAIGSGWEKAVSRLLFNEFRRTHGLDRTLYDCFDAKANAEMAAGVGYAWDAMVVTSHGTTDVRDGVKELIERVWSDHNRSPFEKYNKKKHMPLPPKNWEGILRGYCEDIMRPSYRKKPAKKGGQT
jgi:hypothetical protein